MKERRGLIIIIILFIIIAVIFGLWFLARQKQQEAGTTPSSFREFIGLGGEKGTVSPIGPGGEGSSDFTDGEGTNTDGTGNGTNGGTNGIGEEPTTGTSVFTDTPLIPTAGSVEDPNAPVFGQTGSTPTVDGTTPTTPPTIPGTTALQCSNADTNILFTADELARLRVLQDRFYLIAENLHTDADANTELANHDMFKGKVDKFVELYNYCQAHPIAGRRLPTPFWQNTAQNNSSFLLSAVSPTNPRITLGSTPTGTTSTSTVDPTTGQTTTTTTNNTPTVDTTTSITFPADNTRGQFDINDPNFGMRALEYILKLDVW